MYPAMLAKAKKKGEAGGDQLIYQSWKEVMPLLRKSLANLGKNRKSVSVCPFAETRRKVKPRTNAPSAAFGFQIFQSA
jgi:hypothetical protein